MKILVRPRRAKIVLFAIAAILLSSVVTTAAVLAVDVYLHKRFEKVAGLNIWGYRGPLAKQKIPGERRVVVLGGSAAWGYGVGPEDSLPAYLERKLNAGRDARGISVVNLAGNNEGAYSFVFTLRHYDYLDYDLALFYEGYNNLAPNTSPGFRHLSPIFRLTGYFPILPIILEEKAMALRYGGDLEAAYRREKTVFRPNIVDRAKASALETAASISQSLDRQLGRLSNEPEARVMPSAPDCGGRWSAYCGSVQAAIDHVLARGRRVLVVTQPYIADTHVEQQAALRDMLRARYGGEPRVKYADAGRVIDLKDRSIAYDGMHLTPPGNERIAAALLEPVLDALR